ncbi:MAG: hypothetical protein FJZ04_04165 [Candidatus Moranbacteria bacterium]|nr:hypothetical protein [Candidatus Moranbacteria bacterium]
MAKDLDYLAFRLKKMKVFLRGKYGPEALGILKRIDGMESIKERKRRRDLVRELHKKGYSLREIGALMNLTGQGVSSIIKSRAKYRPRKSKKSEKQKSLF